MKAINSTVSYGWVAVGLHWLMAPAIVAMFILGVWMRTLGYYDHWYHTAPEIHKSAGMLLFAVLLFRFSWRLANRHPDLLGRPWENILARMAHGGQYLLLFMVMITGYLIPTAEGVGIDVFGWFTVPATFTFSKAQADFIGLLHKYSAWALILLAGLHAAAALKHHFVDRDTTLLRILGISRKP